MKISTQFGFAFLATPKCASTSIESTLTDLCNMQFSGHKNLKHIDAQTYMDKVYPLHKHLFPSLEIETFCLIRNPLDWIQSWYRYRSRPALKNPTHPNHKNYTGNIGYNEFIESYIAKGERKPYARIQTQYDFMKLNDGNVGIDHIIPLDRMDLVTDFIREKTGRRISIPQLNKSPRKSSPLIIDKEIKKKLCHHLANDIALYKLVKKHGEFTRSLHANEFSPAQPHPPGQASLQIPTQCQ